MTIDRNGDAHGPDGKYVPRGRRDGVLVLPSEHPDTVGIRESINNVFPTAAIAYTAHARGGNGYQFNRLDLILDSAGKVLWDYHRDMTTDQDPGDRERQTDMLYRVRRHQERLQDEMLLDEATPLSLNSGLIDARRYHHRQLRVIRLNPVEADPAPTTDRHRPAVETRTSWWRRAFRGSTLR